MVSPIAPLAMLLLLVRAATSRDSKWKRITASMLVGWALLLPVVLPEIPGYLRYYSFTQAVSHLLVGLYLFYWSGSSDDHGGFRIASLIMGLLVIVPIIGLMALMGIGILFFYVL